MEFPDLPDMPEEMSATVEFVTALRLLRLDDEWDTLNLYIGISDILIAETFHTLERRIVALETAAH